MTRPGRSDTWPLRRIVSVLVALVLLAISISVPLATAGTMGPAPDRFNIGNWELHRAPGKFLYAIDRLFSDNPTLEQENATLKRFFDLTYQIDTMEAAQSQAEAKGQPRDPAQDAELKARRNERLSIQRESQRILQSRISQVLADQGITRSALVTRVVWPPVNFEFADAPRMLAVSPRNRIFLKRQELLQADLSLSQVEAIEDRTEQRDSGVRARAFPLGGFGAYPSLIDYGDDYLATLQVAAHEWTHNYLFFRPLGFDYAKNNDLTTMNETTADLIGHEVAAEAARRWPLDTSHPAPTPTPATGAASEPRFDLTTALRKLRGEVDALLAQGKVDEAEALMAQRTQEFAAQGSYVRRLNQAYFAFLNLYAGSAGNGVAVNPIGPKIDQLRQRSKSLRAFVDTVGNLTSVSDLDRALGN